MPTSAQDPRGAVEQRRDVLRSSEFDKEREWIPLWAAGPILGVLGVLGATGIVWAVLALRDAIALYLAH